MTFHQRFQLRVETLMREGFLFGSSVVQARVEMVWDEGEFPKSVWSWVIMTRAA